METFSTKSLQLPAETDGLRLPRPPLQVYSLTHLPDIFLKFFRSLCLFLSSALRGSPSNAASRASKGASAGTPRQTESFTRSDTTAKSAAAAEIVCDLAPQRGCWLHKPRKYSTRGGKLKRRCLSRRPDTTIIIPTSWKTRPQ